MGSLSCLSGLRPARSTARQRHPQALPKAAPSSASSKKIRNVLHRRLGPTGSPYSRTVPILKTSEQRCQPSLSLPLLEAVRTLEKTTAFSLSRRARLDTLLQTHGLVPSQRDPAERVKTAIEVLECEALGEMEEAWRALLGLMRQEEEKREPEKGNRHQTDSLATIPHLLDSSPPNSLSSPTYLPSIEHYLISRRALASAKSVALQAGLPQRTLSASLHPLVRGLLDDEETALLALAREQERVGDSLGTWNRKRLVAAAREFGHFDDVRLGKEGKERGWSLLKGRQRDGRKRKEERERRERKMAKRRVHWDRERFCRVWGLGEVRAHQTEEPREKERRSKEGSMKGDSDWLHDEERRLLGRKGLEASGDF